ncbi:MAG: ATP-dependent sacrificial sulfur transferase LarE [Clostridiales bacterium]|nr:ATP-dependent sacrificial sulfur transferase LarE [Clostridiales bacterium]
MTDMNLGKKLNLLAGILQSLPSAAVAFSGGVDSTFLLKYAHGAMKGRVVAATAAAPSFAPDETAEAADFCKSEGIRHIVVNMGDAFLDSFADNPADRCYICKKNMLQRLLAHTELAGMVLLDGSNTDDALDYRPGERALLELGVQSPLREASLSKEEIRTAAKAMGLSVWGKPAFACLASRIPYGERITVGKLASIYRLEKLLHENGFSQVRVRHHGDVARIEVLPEDRKKFFNTDFMEKINKAAKEAGFIYAALDLGGYKMGNLNMSTKNV